MEDHSPVDDILAHHLPSIAEEDDDVEEHFMTVSLDDNVWMEEPVPERHLCIHENSQHDLCPYPCLYSLNLLHITQEDALQYTDLNHIFKFRDVIVTASNEDVPHLEDILRLQKMQTIIYKNFVHEDGIMDTETDYDALPGNCDTLCDQGHVYK